jgi:SAM-dependent methyltransferase
MRDENSIIVEAWNTVLFQKFSRFKHLLIGGLSGHSDEALARHPPPKGARVLDVGCGFGDSTLRIATAVGESEGRAVGVDCAPNFIETARETAKAAAIENASFFVGDAQWDDLKDRPAGIESLSSDSTPTSASAATSTRRFNSPWLWGRRARSSGSPARRASGAGTWWSRRFARHSASMCAATASGRRPAPGS